MAQRVRRPKAPVTKTLERRIKFYRVDTGTIDTGQPKPFDAAGVLGHIEKLAGSGANRWKSPDNLDFGAWVDQIEYPQKMRFGIWRSDDGLQIEREKGALTPLTVDDLIGVVHVVFFDNRTVGSDFNFVGPRIQRLGPYLTDIAGSICGSVGLVPLMRNSAVDQLDRLGRVRLLRLRIRSSYIAKMREVDDNLAATLDVAQHVSDAEELEIVLKPAAYSHGWLSDRMPPIVRKLASRDDLEDGVAKFDVRGENISSHLIEEIDALSDVLMSKKKIVSSRGQGAPIDHVAFYEAIEEAYGELKDQLEKAPEVYL